MKASTLLQQKKEEAKLLLKEKKDSIKGKATEKIGKAKLKSEELKTKARNVVLSTDRLISKKSSTELKTDYETKL